MSSPGPSTPSRTYHVQSTLGKGGFGTVYRAELKGEGGFTKLVALKVLNADMEGLDEIAQRMRDEARVLGLVRHRAIVQVDGLVRLNGRWTIVMEMVNGVDLKLVAEKHQVPPGPALEMAGEIAGALHAAYTCPGPSGAPLCILHRDIKPSNAQLTALGEVKVLDFGIARADFEGREAVTRSLTFGSLEYMAPERMDLIDTPAGDVYALGSVLYELLMGQMLGKTSINPKRHDERLEERLLALQARLGGGSEPMLELLRSILAYEHEDRPDAREVERQCARLRRNWPEPMLRDWAEEVVPELISTRLESPADDLTGSTLYERTDSRSVVVPAASGPEVEAATAPPTAPPVGVGPWADTPQEREPLVNTRWEPIDPAALGGGERLVPGPLVPGKTTTSPRRARESDQLAPKPLEPTLAPAVQASTVEPPEVPVRLARRLVWLGLIAFLGLGAVITVVAVTTVALWPGSNVLVDGPAGLDGIVEVAPPVPQAATQPTEGIEVAVVEEPAPVAEPAPAPRRRAKSASRARTAPAPVAASVPEEPPASTPAPAVAATGATVRFAGDATSVFLLTGSQRYALPTQVPAGSYEIEAVFPNRGQVRAGQVRVIEGAELTLQCQDAFGRCSAG